jgi:hypothetical protein
VYKKVNEFVESKIAVLGGLLVLGVFSLWVVSDFVPPVRDFMVDNGFLDVVIFVILFDILRRVVDLKLEGRQSGVKVSADQDEAWPAVQEYIDKNKPAAVDLMEYSGGTVVSLLEALCKANTKVHLRVLICHPAKAISGGETGRIEQTLWYLLHKLAGYGNLDVRCYQAPAAMRGRSFDRDLVSVGWYTYHSRRQTPELQGHLNAMVTGSGSTADGKHLQATFTQAFEALWNHMDTVDARTVLPLAGGAPAQPPEQAPIPPQGGLDSAPEAR